MVYLVVAPPNVYVAQTLPLFQCVFRIGLVGLYGHRLEFPYDIEFESEVVPCPVQYLALERIVLAFVVTVGLVVFFP